MGYDLDTTRSYPGGRVPLTLYWQALHPLDRSYKVFVQLDPDQKYAQADSIPVCARYPTNLWRPGQIITDHHVLHISPTTPPGSHRLDIGFYLPDTGQRLELLNAAGEAAGTSLTLTELTIGPSSNE